MIAFPRPSKRLMTVLFLSGAFLCSSCKVESPDDPLPNASYTYTSARNFPVQVQFANTSTTTGGTATYSWDFGDGTPPLTGSGAAVNNPIHAYTIPATYIVRLTQTESGGAQNTVTKTLTLTQDGPSGFSARTSAADFVYAIAGSSFSVRFRNQSQNAGNFLWDFGDGTTSQTADTAFTKTFSAPGTYRVKLTASSPGGTDTCSATIGFN